MQFKPEMINKIVSGQKVQTRRLVKDKELYNSDNGDIVVVHKNKKTKWLVGNKYSIQPCRGKKTVEYCLCCKKSDPVINSTGTCESCNLFFLHTPLQIRILAIRKEKLMKITETEARKEGFPIEMFPDKRARNSFLKYFHYVNNLNRAENTKVKGAFYNPDVWVIDFTTTLGL